jgi:hypothetical protein
MLHVTGPSSNPAILGYNADSGAGIRGESTNGYGVYGANTSTGNSGHVGGPSYGVYGSSSSGRGVYGFSSSGRGVYGECNGGTGVYGIGSAGVYGEGPTYGVQGYSTSHEGVIGVGWLDGVYGSSEYGDGVHGRSISGYGGYFEGPKNYFEGNVGIGTDSPTTKLEVKGGSIKLTDEWSNIYGKNLKIWGADNSDLLLQSAAGAGNVGIGTTSPNGKLDVNGAIYQRGSVLHADYVFEPDYQLESIDEHSEFMWMNKHLKAIPKSEVDEDGREILEVGAHRKGIVEELEKAHIYIDQLHNRLKALEEKEAEVDQMHEQVSNLIVRLERMETIMGQISKNSFERIEK